MRYENGKESAELILKACRKLFYEKGYRATSFDDIAREAHVYRTAIAYHFKNKKALADRIGEEVINREVIEILKYAGDTPYHYYVYEYTTLYKMLKDRNYLRFLIESDALSAQVWDDNSTYTILRMAGLDHSFQEFVDKYHYSIIAYSAYTEYMCRNLYEMDKSQHKSFIEYARINLNIWARLFDVPSDVMKENVAQAETIVSRLPLEKFDCTLG